MKSWALLLLWAVPAWAGSPSSTSTATAAPVSIDVPHRLILQVGESALYAPASALVELVSLSDSRCPEGARCIWAGEISALLRVTRPGFPAGEVSTGWLGGPHSPGEYAGLFFRFSEISPSPGPAGAPFDPAKRVIYIDVSDR